MKKIRVDVVVIGGGSAGIAAAIAAARHGARTFLIEKEFAVGGIIRSSLIHSTCGIYPIDTSLDAPSHHAGIPAEIADLLLQSRSAQKKQMGRVSVLLHPPQAFLAACQNLLSQEPMLSLFLATRPVAVRSKAGMIQSIDFLSGTDNFSVSPVTVVDASGDASFSFLAGARCQIAPPALLQRPAFVFEVRHAFPDVLDDAGRLVLAQQIVEAIRLGDLPHAALGTSFRCVSPSKSIFVSIDLSPSPPAAYDPLNEVQLSDLYNQARSLAEKIFLFLKKQSPVFRQSDIVSWPSALGIRESRRIVGKYELTAADILDSRWFEDAVATTSWPMELRETARGPKIRFPSRGIPCGIPLRCLQSADFSNLFAAGKIISATHEAQASVRVVGSCLSTGEAAGKTAARFACLQKESTERL